MNYMSFRRWRSYLLLEIKKGMKLIPFFAVSMIGTCLTILIAAVLFCTVMDRQSLLPKASVAIVTTVENTDTGTKTDAQPDLMTTLAVNTVSQMDSVRLLADFSYLTQEEAQSGLSDGSLDAAIYIAPDTYDDINSGVNTPVTVRLSPSAAELERNLFASLVSAGVRMIRSVEASVYTPYKLSEGYELTAEPQAIGDMIFDLYLKLALGRVSLWEEESVSAFGNLSMLQFYLVSGIILVMLLFGMGFSCFYGSPEQQVLFMLKRSGVPGPAADMARLLSVTLVYMLFALLLFLAGSLLPGTVTEAGPKEILTVSLPGITCIAFLLASLTNFMGKLLPESAFPLIWLLFVILMCILSGSIIPSAWLPESLREITAYCPYAVCQTAAAEVLVPGQAADRYLTGAPVLAAIEGILLFIPAYLGGKYRGK